jgi:DNA-directed RNA polymerase sigma subunit (sigma70/sigma32)
VKSLGEFDDYVSYMTDGYLAAIRNWKEEMNVTIGHYCFVVMFRRIKRYKEMKYKRQERYRQHQTEELESEIVSYRKGEDADTKEEINHILRNVKSEKTLEMIQKKFGLNGERKHTLKELTDYYGMPTETIRIRIQRELKKLKGKKDVNSR